MYHVELSRFSYVISCSKMILSLKNARIFLFATGLSNTSIYLASRFQVTDQMARIWFAQTSPLLGHQRNKPCIFHSRNSETLLRLFLVLVASCLLLYLVRLYPILWRRQIWTGNSLCLADLQSKKRNTINQGTNFFYSLLIYLLKLWYVWFVSHFLPFFGFDLFLTLLVKLIIRLLISLIFSFNWKESC